MSLNSRVTLVSLKATRRMLHDLSGQAAAQDDMQLTWWLDQAAGYIASAALRIEVRTALPHQHEWRTGWAEGDIIRSTFCKVCGVERIEPTEEDIRHEEQVSTPAYVPGRVTPIVRPSRSRD